MRKICVISAFLAVLLALAACDLIDDISGKNNPPGDVFVTGVSLNKTSASLALNGTETLFAIIEPDNATNKDVTWTSSNTSVATVSDGVVTAKNAGTALIIAATKDGGYQATCTVTIGYTTPVPEDYNISGTGTFTYDGDPKLVTVTPKEGKSVGAVIVKYNGSTTAPSAVGIYTVTFDVTAVASWNGASGLSAGTLEITTANNDGFSLAFTVEQILDGAPIINAITISRTNTGAYPFTRAVSITASDYDPGSIKWEIAGVGVYSGQTVNGNGSSFTLDARDTRYNTLGIHALVLTVSISGIQYQRNILFTIVK